MPLSVLPPMLIAGPHQTSSEAGCRKWTQLERKINS